jgi:hypothetical protein
LLFNIREINNEENIWYSWDEVELWAEELNVPTVPVLYRGTLQSESELQYIIESFMDKHSLCGGIREGVVIRVSDSFNDEDFSKKRNEVCKSKSCINN